MADAWKSIDRETYLQVVDGSFINLGANAASIAPVSSVTLKEYYITGKDFPVQVETAREASLDITALLSGDDAASLIEDINEEDRRRAIFFDSHPEHNFWGPAGYVDLTESSAPDDDGVVVINSAAIAAREEPFQNGWKYGTFIDNSVFTNSWRPLTNDSSVAAGLKKPSAGQWMFILVERPLNLWGIEMRYRARWEGASRNWQFDIPGLQAIPEKRGLFIAQLKSTDGNSTPVPGDTTNGEYYFAFQTQKQGSEIIRFGYID